MTYGESPTETPLQRSNLSSEVLERLRRKIVDGELVAGQRLNEVELASQLQVSRTPLREALSQLVAESWARSIPRRGFFVAPLSGEEVRELYPIRQLLDPEALRLAGLPDPGRLERLERLNEGIARATRPRSIIDLDDRWHLELVAGCPNRILLDLIRQFMRRTRRYETAYMSDGQNVTVATDEHRHILERLREGDLVGACLGLRRNLSTATEPLLAWIEEKHGSNPQGET